ncbi:MAG: hypothetical protein HW416_162 [Chloroflexi bacterium]|nr:hypothetical protein [Chloroflexota bacterium]
MSESQGGGGSYRPPMRLQQALAGAARVVLTGHIDPDADVLGSVLGLANILGREGWDTLPVCIGEMPSFLASLPGHDRVVQYPGRAMADSPPGLLLRPGDALVVMDTPIETRMGAFYNQHKSVLPNCRTVVFDHHFTNSLYGDINFLNPIAAATAEVVCDVLDASDIAIDEASATCFMAALLADTQCFRTENTSPRSLLRGYQLASAGAPIYPLAEVLFKTRPTAGLRLWGVALSSLQEQAGVIWTAVTNEMLRETQATMEEVEGLVDFLLSSRDARVAIVLKEEIPGETKVSMRTVPGVDATRIVGAFGGGGHQRAAGCTIDAAPDAAIAQLLVLVLDELGEVVPAA